MFTARYGRYIPVRQVAGFSFCKNLWTSIFSFFENLNKIDALIGFHVSGLVTKLTDDQKYGIIEAIAHLIHRDYNEIVKDFVKLDFIPDGVNLEPILPVLAKVFDQALEGGGAKNINFQELASDLAKITFDYPFRIPPYFALIIRGIGVLEGIALVGNPDFAIVDEAYPYLAQVVKAIDAVSREQLLQIAAFLGIGTAAPVFSMAPLRPAVLLPTITEEDRVILNNVEKVAKFLTSGTSKASSHQRDHPIRKCPPLPARKSGIPWQMSPTSSVAKSLALIAS
ncbi:hypothetical protein BHE74_00023520 [Ensete ventricosum]|nr:hypothetical protein BHE74_00023520 [Ensete ventricosum]RZS02109.1 hypothetical protein BHM03_00032088 [Ensete ventricosum]